MNATVRQAELSDAAAIAQIFNLEVEAGHGTYETVAHSETQRREWLKTLLERKFPILVATDGPHVIGFAALTPFHPASGYQKTATAQIYLSPAVQGKGLGTQLVRALFHEAVKVEFHSIIAGVNSRNLACQALLRKIGFRAVGHFRQIGFKNGQWWDDTCFQLILPTKL